MTDFIERPKNWKEKINSEAKIMSLTRLQKTSVGNYLFEGTIAGESEQGFFTPKEMWAVVIALKEDKTEGISTEKLLHRDFFVRSGKAFPKAKYNSIIFSSFLEEETIKNG